MSQNLANLFVQLPADLRVRVRVWAAETDRTIAAVVIEALERALNARQAAHAP